MLSSPVDLMLQAIFYLVIASIARVGETDKITRMIITGCQLWAWLLLIGAMKLYLQQCCLLDYIPFFGGSGDYR
jgi:hypothetical protein